MIAPHVKPKHDFTLATVQTALRNADTLSNAAYNYSIAKSHDRLTAVVWKTLIFTYAVKGAELLQNFMNANKGKD